jgi:hypothetical protein
MFQSAQIPHQTMNSNGMQFPWLPSPMGTMAMSAPIEQQKFPTSESLMMEASPQQQHQPMDGLTMPSFMPSYFSPTNSSNHQQQHQLMTKLLLQQATKNRSQFDFSSLAQQQQQQQHTLLPPATGTAHSTTTPMNIAALLFAQQMQV